MKREKPENSKQRVSKAPKRKAVIRVESEETQDYVRESRICDDLSQEEADEIGFVPSA